MDLEEERAKRKKILRLILLKRLIENMFENKVDNTPVLPNSLYNENGSPRRQYFSPLDRSNYNYGYMTLDEIGAGTPTIW